MVSLTSYSNSTGVYQNAVNGQKQVIASVPNVFTGPNTDVIQIPRDGGAGRRTLSQGMVLFNWQKPGILS